MSDPRLLRVATIATNMPDQFGTLNYDQQVRLLSAKIDMKQLVKPGQTDKFVEKYLAINAATSASGSDPLANLLTSSQSVVDITSSLLPSISSTSSNANLLTLFA